MNRQPARVAAAYAACERLARSHYENFPVASHLLPSAMRPHIAAVYAFARLADDLADEGDVPPDVRRSRLAAWRDRLHAAVNRDDFARLDDPSEADDAFVFVALGHSVRTLELPIELFDDLVSAFAQDTTTTRYASWSDVFDYCRRSANPVGRLVLRIAGYRDEALDRASDALCTALQLTNFWQDFGRDWQAGRLYVPREVLATCGAEERALAPIALHAGTATVSRSEPLSAAWTAAIQRCADVTRGLFRQGRPVCDGVRGRLRLELRLTWLGGMRILDRVDRDAAALLARRPVLGRRDVPGLLWRAARWGNGPA